MALFRLTESAALRRTAVALRRAAAAAALAPLAAACGSSTSPTAPSTTQTFTGQLAAHASVVYPFTVAQDGSASLTLTSLAPQATITMGMGIGTPASGNSCALQTVYEAASVGYTLSGPITAGSYCIAFYDVGNVLASVSYVLTLTHT